MAEKRKLAAILAADVVGFSRLTAVDDRCALNSGRSRAAWRIGQIDPKPPPDWLGLASFSPDSFR